MRDLAYKITAIFILHGIENGIEMQSISRKSIFTYKDTYLVQTDSRFTMTFSFF